MIERGESGKVIKKVLTLEEMAKNPEFARTLLDELKIPKVPDENRRLEIINQATLDYARQNNILDPEKIKVIRKLVVRRVDYIIDLLKKINEYQNDDIINLTEVVED